MPGGSDSKESTCNGGDLGSIPGWGRSPGGGHGNPFQQSCLENHMDRGAWQARVLRLAKRWSNKHTCMACKTEDFLDDSACKESACNAGDMGGVALIPGSGRSPGEGNGNLLQYSCLENSMDRGAWQGYNPWGSQRVGHD